MLVDSDIKLQLGYVLIDHCFAEIQFYAKLHEMSEKHNFAGGVLKGIFNFENKA